MKNNGTLLKIYRGVTIIVLAAGVFGIFNMNGAIIRLEEQMGFVKYRLSAIESQQFTISPGGTYYGRPD